MIVTYILILKDPIYFQNEHRLFFLLFPPNVLLAPVLEIRTVFRADRGSGSFENKGGSRIADLAPSDIRRIFQIRLPNADPYYIFVKFGP
jgi:hypothetical protein